MSDVPDLADFEPITKTSPSDLPDDVKEQLKRARINRTHTAPKMIRWLEAQGFTVTQASLENWFLREGVRAGRTGRMVDG